MTLVGSERVGESLRRSLNEVFRNLSRQKEKGGSRSVIQLHNDRDGKENESKIGVENTYGLDTSKDGR